MNELIKYSEQTFESIKHVNEYGEEYWLARELQPVLEYAQWRRFSDAIERAKLACKNSGFAVEEPFCRRRQKWLTSAPVQNVRSMMSCFPGMLAT